MRIQKKLDPALLIRRDPDPKLKFVDSGLNILPQKKIISYTRCYIKDPEKKVPDSKNQKLPDPTRSGSSPLLKSTACKSCTSSTCWGREGWRTWTSGGRCGGRTRSPCPTASSAGGKPRTTLEK